MAPAYRLAAARAGVAMVPVVFSGTRTLLRGDQWFPRPAHVTVHVGAPVTPKGHDWAAVLALRDEVRAQLLAHLGEPDLAAE